MEVLSLPRGLLRTVPASSFRTRGKGTVGWVRGDCPCHTAAGRQRWDPAPFHTGGALNPVAGPPLQRPALPEPRPPSTRGRPSALASQESPCLLSGFSPPWYSRVFLPKYMPVHSAPHFSAPGHCQDESQDALSFRHSYRSLPTSCLHRPDSPAS